MHRAIASAALACFLMAAGAAAAQTKPEQPPKPAPPTTKPDQPGKPAEVNPSAAKPAVSGDNAFITQAATDGMAEVELGRLAAQNASSPEVKQFAQRMVDDHSKANDELKSLASKKNVTLPAAPDAKQKAMQQKFEKQKGASFDAAYMDHMVKDHQQAVALFQREAKGGKDPDVKAWAEKTLPTLQEHLKMAKEVHAKAGKTSASK